MRKREAILDALALFLLVTGALLIAALNPRLTKYVESDSFRAAMEQETAKGLHFKRAHFAPIRRTGLLTAARASFQGSDGFKAMTKIDACGVTTRFNPLGIFLRRWQLDELHIASGQVGIQT